VPEFNNPIVVRL